MYLFFHFGAFLGKSKLSVFTLFVTVSTKKTTYEQLITKNRFKVMINKLVV